MRQHEDPSNAPWFDLSPWWLTILIIVLLGMILEQAHA
jgi:hypothetical protein